jgi:hypothetical protein
MIARNGIPPREAAEPQAPTAVAPKRLFLTKLVLVLLAIGLCVVGTRTRLWPVVTWPMYHGVTPEVPPPRVTVTQLRVVDRAGGLHLLTFSELMTATREDAAERFVDLAFSSSPDRRWARKHLIFLVERALGGVDVAAIEALERTWRVDPYATPPLDRSAPVREVVSGRFTDGIVSAAQATP